MTAAWHETLREADSLALAGQHAAADSVLAAFAASDPESHAAREIAFWRALYALDPANEEATRAQAIAALDAYLEAEDAWWYRREARVLRELATPPPAIVVTEVRDVSELTTAEKDQEIRALRARVSRLNAELEQIRRRLATPPPP